MNRAENRPGGDPFVVRQHISCVYARDDTLWCRKQCHEPKHISYWRKPFLRERSKGVFTGGGRSEADVVREKYWDFFSPYRRKDRIKRTHTGKLKKLFSALNVKKKSSKKIKWWRQMKTLRKPLCLNDNDYVYMTTKEFFSRNSYVY